MGTAPRQWAWRTCMGCNATVRASDCALRLQVVGNPDFSRWRDGQFIASNTRLSSCADTYGFSRVVRPFLTGGAFRSCANTPNLFFFFKQKTAYEMIW